MGGRIREGSGGKYAARPAGVTARNYISRNYISPAGPILQKVYSARRRAGSEVRPGSDQRRPAASRQPFPSTGQNGTDAQFGPGLAPLFENVQQFAEREGQESPPFN